MTIEKVMTVIMFVVQFCFYSFSIVNFKVKVKKSLKIPKRNRNRKIEEEQTTQWPNKKVQKNKQRSTKHTHKTKDRVTRPPLKTGGELEVLQKRVWRRFLTGSSIIYFKLILDRFDAAVHRIDNCSVTEHHLYDKNWI